MTTTHHMGGGFWAHIKWVEDKGFDQHGRKWVNKSDPKLENKVQQAVFDNCMQNALDELNRIVLGERQTIK